MSNSPRNPAFDRTDASMKLLARSGTSMLKEPKRILYVSKNSKADWDCKSPKIFNTIRSFQHSLSPMRHPLKLKNMQEQKNSPRVNTNLLRHSVMMPLSSMVYLPTMETHRKAN